VARRMPQRQHPTPNGESNLSSKSLPVMDGRAMLMSGAALPP
jgi:hypothetical protein